MALEPYSPCPCGSGKKFKWCCQPIHVEIDQAFRQDADGQHDAALKTMEQVVAAHPENPEAWGRKAELLYRNGQVEPAEEALQKAFEINPNYPFGLLLQGVFRSQEGEAAGALILLRRAADAYSPEAGDQLAQIYALIAETELKMNRPVATRAALHISLHFQPAQEQMRQAMDEYFGERSSLPMAARREYKFLSPVASLPAERRAIWDQALAGAGGGKLSDAARAFQQVTQQDADSPAAWYNLALSRAWLGDNPGALEALDRYVSLETDGARAADAWALGEVLRLGHGMESHADLLESFVFYQMRDPRPVTECLQAWHDSHRLVVLQARQDQPVFSALVLEKVTSLTADPSAAPPPHLASYIMMVGDRVRLWSTNRELFDKVREEFQQKAGAVLVGGKVEQTTANFNDVLSQALVFPVNTNDQAEVERIVRQNMERYFEEAWIHRPLKALGGVPPIDAAGHGTLAKKLAGVVEFLEQCAAGGNQPYDFNRLRQKLGLQAGGAAAPAPQAVAAPAATGPDLTGLGAAELAGLDAKALALAQLEQAYQTALKLDARDLAGRFAEELVSRPAAPERPDRFPWYTHLVQLALANGDTSAALDWVTKGARADAEQNEGRRANDYDLRRGQIHAKRGEADEAQTVFDRVIERSPGELRYRGSAAEALLSARQGARALKFAEGGLAKAREQNNRDSEQYFLELAAAARKQQ